MNYESLFYNKSEYDQEQLCDSLYKESLENCDYELLVYLIKTFPEHIFYNSIMYNDIELIKMMILEFGINLHKKNNLAVLYAIRHNNRIIFEFLMNQNAVLYSDNRYDNRVVDEYIEKIGILSMNKINL